MASEDGILAQRLECSLCLELMTEPKLLSCSHTFCDACLNRLYQCRRRENELSCPTCRQTTRVHNGDVSKLQTNFPIKAMVNDLVGSRSMCTVCDSDAQSIASVYCQMCNEYLCDVCLEGHGKYRKTAKHEVVTVDDIRKGKVKVKRFCQKHPQEEKQWVCRTCNVSVCFRCRVLDHNDPSHHLEDVSDFQKEMIDRIEALQKGAEEKIKSFERYMKKTDEQDAKIEEKINEVIADINGACEEAIQQLIEKRDDLTGQCEEYKMKLKTQLRNINEISRNVIQTITSACELVSNGIKAILEGETLVVHNAICSDLGDMLAARVPDDSTPVALMKQAENVEFLKYQGERYLGQVEMNTLWELERVKTFPLSGNGGWEMHPTAEGGMVVGYFDGGFERFTLDGTQGTVLNHVKVVRFCSLRDGRYVIRDSNHTAIKLYSPHLTLLPANFDINFRTNSVGVCADKNDTIYVGNNDAKTIVVFRPEGGAPIREIPCHGFTPFYIRHMNRSNLLVLTDKCSVRVIDKEGTVKYEVAKQGYNARFAVLRDDSILIGWRENQLLTFDLYTPQLRFVGTVLNNFAIDQYAYYPAEFQTGEIAFTDDKNFYVFRKKYLI